MSLAMKRVPSARKENQPEKKRIKTEEPNNIYVSVNDPSIPIPGLQMAEGFDLPEILQVIFTKLLEEYPRDPIEKNPFIAVHLVSSQWNNIMSGQNIHSFLRGQPNSARQLLRIKGLVNISADNNLDLVKSAMAWLSDEDLRIIMLNAKDCETMLFCSSQRKLRLISERQYEEGYNALMVASGRAFPIRNLTPDFVLTRVNLVEHEKTSTLETGLIFTLPQRYFLNLLFLEDLQSPFDFTWPYSLFLQCLCYNYHNHPESHKQLADWIAPFKYATLPHLQRSLIWECLSLPIILAAFAGDRKFFKILDLDTSFTSFWAEKYKSLRVKSDTAKIFVVLDDIVNGRLNYVTGKALNAIEITFSIRERFGLLGWSRDILRERLLRLPITDNNVSQILLNWLQG